VHEHLLVHLQGATNCELDEAQLASWPTLVASLVGRRPCYVPCFELARQDAATRLSLTATSLAPLFRH
jgi:hypothetical protein